MELNVEELKSYLDCDNEFLLRVIEGFMSESKELMEEIDEALEKGDKATVGSSAHKMLSSTRILQLTDLSVELEKLEDYADEERDIESMRQSFTYTSDIWYGVIAKLTKMKAQLK